MKENPLPVISGGITVSISGKNVLRVRQAARVFLTASPLQAYRPDQTRQTRWTICSPALVCAQAKKSSAATGLLNK